MINKQKRLPSQFPLLLLSSVFVLCLIHPSSYDFLSHFNTNEHHIIFNEIGQIATSMSYLHIGIPVNLTSIQHHITAFSSYLTRFSSLQTDHPNKLQFQRVITELAGFAKRKIDKLSTKLAFIDHVLPEDPTPLLVTNVSLIQFCLKFVKRMITKLELLLEPVNKI